jgi:hypothetical protein
VVLDVICQLIVFRRLYPGEALLVAAILAILPYLVVRASQPHRELSNQKLRRPVAESIVYQR